MSQNSGVKLHNFHCTGKRSFLTSLVQLYNIQREINHHCYSLPLIWSVQYSPTYKATRLIRPDIRWTEIKKNSTKLSPLKRGDTLHKSTFPLQKGNLFVFSDLRSSEIWPDKRCGLIRRRLLYTNTKKNLFENHTYIFNKNNAQLL